MAEEANTAATTAKTETFQMIGCLHEMVILAFKLTVVSKKIDN
jgi:hypothetical protein